ncbi:MAG TPA: DegT/DnrJ/EryC1/StrS family aminotransferase, partial [Syntrophales bacterium]|nr:DegT/DnrJ/EryC1/StrS family aminotransferase [Syntrophales bacterium]
FNMPEEARAKRFQQALGAEGVDTVCYKDNLWHYLPNWEHFLAKSTANSKRYPFADPSYKGKVTYDKSGFPKAEDLLGRTLVMGINVKMPTERLDAVRRGIEKAAKAL